MPVGSHGDVGSNPGSTAKIFNCDQNHKENLRKKFQTVGRIEDREKRIQLKLDHSRSMNTLKHIDTFGRFSPAHERSTFHCFRFDKFIIDGTEKV